MSTLDELMTAEEVAKLLRRKKREVYRLATRGAIPALKIGGARLFRKASILAWLEEEERRQTTAAAQKAKHADDAELRTLELVRR